MIFNKKYMLLLWN